MNEVEVQIVREQLVLRNDADDALPEAHVFGVTSELIMRDAVVGACVVERIFGKQFHSTAGFVVGEQQFYFYIIRFEIAQADVQVYLQLFSDIEGAIGTFLTEYINCFHVVPMGNDVFFPAEQFADLLQVVVGEDVVSLFQFVVEFAVVVVQLALHSVVRRDFREAVLHHAHPAGRDTVGAGVEGRDDLIFDSGIEG